METAEHTPVEEKVGRKPITWKDVEYIHSEKGADWYWALGLIAVAGAVTSLSFHNILFAIFILIAAFVLAIFAAREPDEVTFSISQRGVRIDDKLYPFETLEAFGIEELSSEHTPKLILKSKKILVPNIIISLEKVNENEVHDFLQQFLHQEELNEPLIHKIMEWLGF